MKILIGADPEIFMYKNGVPISAHAAVSGTKEKPFKVKDGAVQVDGMALEFNIDPADSAQVFVNNLESVMATLKSMVPGYDLLATPVAEFGHDYIKAQPPEALVLGCDPDFDAWNDGKVNPRPDGNNPFRTGAGHVHIGWTDNANQHDPNHIQGGIMLTKQLDFFLGLPSLLYDKDTKRRTMYGAPGAFRPKPYGVEYRVLSNAWLTSPKLMSWVFNNTQEAVYRLADGDRVYDSYHSAGMLKLMASKNPDLDQVKEILYDLDIDLPPQVI